MAATIALASHAPAMAQYQKDTAIVVSAPIIEEAVGTRNGVHPEMQVTSKMLVEAGDLDLRTEYGRDVLEARVRIAADEVCDRLDELDPPTAIGAFSNPDFGDCRHNAVMNARPQMREAMILASR